MDKYENGVLMNNTVIEQIFYLKPTFKTLIFYYISVHNCRGSRIDDTDWVVRALVYLYFLAALSMSPLLFQKTGVGSITS